MKFPLLFFLLFPLFSISEYHKFYVSVTEIEHNDKNQTLQVISRVFTDDLENVLKTRYDQELRLSEIGESPDIDALIEKYLSQRFKVEVNGKELKTNFLGKEYENDITVLYIEIPEVEKLINIEVTNSILIDLFEDQKNLIHVEYKGNTKSLILSQGKETDVLNF